MKEINKINILADINIESEPISNFINNDIYLNQYGFDDVQQFVKDTAAVFKCCSAKLLMA